VWQELLEQAESPPDPPCLILTFRLGDDRLWAEALNLGAYDVLAQPFDGEEVVRILSMAWLHWSDPRKSEFRASAPLTMASGM
jgi:DNA-binding response OmpR family regulator